MHATSLTREQARAIDRLASEELGIASIILMENAGLGAALELLATQDVDRPERFGIVCGGGNNGGDGYVVARQLANRGHAVCLFETRSRDELGGDALTNRGIIEKMGLRQVHVRDARELAAASAEFEACSTIVDALLGTGFRGRPRPQAAAVIECMNARPAGVTRVVALDLPSGLDCDVAAATGTIVRADATLTFVAPKRSFDDPASLPWTGAVTVIPIGIPPALVERVASTGDAL